MAIMNCRFEGFKDARAEGLAIQVWNGAGPYKIVNNYLQAAGENIMFGGTDPRIPNLVPSDIEFRSNCCQKPPTWKPGCGFVVKNLFELKNAQRVLIDGNVFDTNYGQSGGQRAAGILFTPGNQNGTAPWSTVCDVTFTNNIVREVGMGIRISSCDSDTKPSQVTTRILIRNNAFLGISKECYPTSKWIGCSYRGHTGESWTIDHNLAIAGPDPSSSRQHLAAFCEGEGGAACDHFVFTNNLFWAGDYGWGGSGAAEGFATLNKWFTHWSWLNNGIVVRTVDRAYAQRSGRSYVAHYYGRSPMVTYAVTDIASVGFSDYAHEDYRLTPKSPWQRAATDGTDLGPDWDTLNRATKCARSGISGK
jgi:hypothetical protein